MRKFLSFLSLCILSSCSTPKDIVYFRDLAKSSSLNSYTENTLKIKHNDILWIDLKTESPEVVSMFDQNRGSMGQNGQMIYTGYLVDSEGNLNLPTVGKIKAAGLTTGELKKNIEKIMLDYVYDVVVEIRIVNNKITILGEVGNPGTIILDEEGLNIVQAIGLAGDLTDFAKRDQIVLIREENSKRIVYEIDLTKSAFFDSPAFFIKQNDIIYVKPNRRKIISSGIINDPFKISSVIALVVTITNLFK